MTEVIFKELHFYVCNFTQTLINQGIGIFVIEIRCRDKIFQRIKNDVWAKPKEIILVHPS